MKKCFTLLLLAGLALPAGAETERTRLTRENRLPDLMHVEAGLDFKVASYDEGDSQTYDPYIRFRPLQDLVVYGNVPYHNVDREVINDSGLGNIAVGAQLVVFEDLDIIKTPWVMLHGQVDLDSADSDLALGSDENATLIGLAVGTASHEDVRYGGTGFWEKLNWAMDLRYSFLDEADDYFSFATSIVKDFSKDFALIGEFEYSEVEEVGEDESLLTILGGLSYEPTDDLTFVVHAGTVEHSAVEFLTAVKLALTF